MPLSKEIILITGAGGGLGSVAAQTLAQLGAQIILLDKSIPKLEKVYDALAATNGPTPILYPFDLAGANEQEYYELAERIQEKYGKLSGLLHSAVEFSAFTPISIHKTKDWGHSVNVNLNAPFLLTRVLLPALEKCTHASIVFTLDSHALKAPAYAGAFGVTNIALQGFAQILSEELEGAQKIRVNSLIHGPVDSPLRKRAFPGEDKTKLMDMQSLAPVYQYLFGPQSIGITGKSIDARTFHL